MTKLKTFNVNFAYTIQVTSENEKDAEDEACDIFRDDPPKLGDFGIEAEEIY